MPSYNAKYISLCRVSDIRERKRYLVRLADIDTKNGILQKYVPKIGIPKMFTNRAELYSHSGPDEIGAFGVWIWLAFPDEKEPYKDCLRISHSEDINIHAIEVIEVSDAYTVRDVIDALKEGISLQPVSPRMLFCTKTGNNRFVEGVYCTASDIDVKCGKVCINANVPSLRSYYLSIHDFITLGGKTFYARLNVPSPGYQFSVRREQNIIALPASAKQDTATDKLQSYSKPDDPTADDKLPASNEQDITADKKPSPEEERLNTLQAGIHQAREELESVSAELEIKKAELTTASQRLSFIKKSIQDNEQLSRRVTENVRERIEQARSDAAAFIAEMAFTRPANPAPAQKAVLPAENLEQEDTETLSDWNHLLRVLRDELIEAGVSQQYSSPLAALLYSAYTNKLPIILAGPNGKDIADAFSVIVSGRKAGVIDCSGEYYAGIREDISRASDEVFAVSNALRSEWITHIPEMFASGKYFFFIHPFAEDLLIEPKGLFSYVLPVFTELIADSLPSGDYAGAKKADNFDNYTPAKTKPLHDTLLTSMGLGLFARSSLHAVLSDFHAMHSESFDNDCLFVLFPYAYITGRHIAELTARLSDSKLREELDSFAGKDE